MRGQDAATAKTKPGMKMPGEERRLCQRVVKAWRSIAQHDLPSVDDIDILDLGNDRENCFCIDLSLSGPQPYFVFIGEELTPYINLFLNGTAPLETDIMDLAAVDMDRAALSKEPVERSAVVKTKDGRRIAFRSVLMPISADGDGVTHIFGAMNGKRVEDNA